MESVTDTESTYAAQDAYNASLLELEGVTAECHHCGTVAPLSGAGSVAVGEALCQLCWSVIRLENVADDDDVQPADCTSCMDRGCALCCGAGPIALPQLAETLTLVARRLASVKQARYVVHCSITGAILTTDHVSASDHVLFDDEAE